MRMKLKYNIWAFVIIGTLGTLLHFAYDFSSENTLVGLFSAVNESIFEHQKLLFFPAAFYFTAEYFILKRPMGFFAADFVGTLSGIISIITLFYTYSGILGKSISVIDISLFYVGVLIALIIRTLIIKNGALNSRSADLFAAFGMLAIAILFWVWTFFPPKISFFIPKMQ